MIVAKVERVELQFYPSSSASSVSEASSGSGLTPLESSYREYRGIVFNERAYYAFRDWTADPNSCVNRDIIGMMTVSSDSEDYLKKAFASPRYAMPCMRCLPGLSDSASLSQGRLVA